MVDHHDTEPPAGGGVYPPKSMQLKTTFETPSQIAIYVAEKSDDSGVLERVVLRKCVECLLAKQVIKTNGQRKPLTLQVPKRNGKPWQFCQEVASNGSEHFATTRTSKNGLTRFWTLPPRTRQQRRQLAECYPIWQSNFQKACAGQTSAVGFHRLFCRWMGSVRQQCGPMQTLPSFNNVQFAATRMPD